MLNFETEVYIIQGHKLMDVMEQQNHYLFYNKFKSGNIEVYATRHILFTDAIKNASQTHESGTDSYPIQHASETLYFAFT